MTILPHLPNWWFDDIIIGRTIEFGSGLITAEDIELFHEKFASNMAYKPSETGYENRGKRAAESHVYTIWRKMLYEETRSWPIIRRLSQDNLRYHRTCYDGDKLHVSMTFLAAEHRNDEEGVLVANHEVLDNDGLIVMSVLTKTLLAKAPK